MATTAVTDTERSKLVEYSLTDLHTHILPGMDDGAECLETALQMLTLEKQSGVDRVALTSHFYPLQEELNEYLERRQQAYGELIAGWEAESMPALCVGAEVRYSPRLMELDLGQLTLGDSDYLLLELSDTRLPSHLSEVVDRMLMQGITPVLAHVERCTYFREEPARLTELIRMGALAQVSARALGDRRDKNFAVACLQNGLAHVIASDAHGVSHRCPCLGDVMASPKKDLLARAETFAQAIWNNEPVPDYAIWNIKKTFLGYR